MSTSSDNVDLRSDTVTQPSPEMRQAMSTADVGDDVYGEDPTARALEEETAAILGTEAALFVPTGTMANQIALFVHCRSGDEVLIAGGSHVAEFESGAAATLARVQFRTVGSAPAPLHPDQLRAALAPASFLTPRQSLVVVENTHNRAGGRTVSVAHSEEIGVVARDHGLRVHLDGARLFNAACALGVEPRTLAMHCDSITITFSKGLGAPVGSAIAGSRAFIEDARRARKMFGGAMRQVGVMCAGALLGLRQNRERLAVDHANARAFATDLAGREGFECDVDAVETNIVNFDVTFGDAGAVVHAARKHGILINAISERTIRAVTHLDVDRAGIGRAVEALSQIAATRLAATRNTRT